MTANIMTDWRDILIMRNSSDRIAVLIDCDLATPGSLNVVTDLVREGLMWRIERSSLSTSLRTPTDNIIKMRVNADIYQLTIKGMRWCNENGITRPPE